MNSALLIFCYFLMAYGLTNLLVNGRGPFDLLTKFRDLVKYLMPGLGNMLDCMMCTSTNVGLVMSAVSLALATPFTPFTIAFGGHYWLLAILLDMFVTSGVVWFIDALELSFERSWTRGDDNVYYDPGIEQKQEDNE